MTAPLSPALTADRVLILDFGSQVTQLIARRVRESGVYCEIHPFTITERQVTEFEPKAIILSGGPALDHPRRLAPRAAAGLRAGRAGARHLLRPADHVRPARRRGRTASDHREFGRAFIDVKEPCALFEGLWDEGAREQVWMSHGDRVTALPAGFRVVAHSEGAPFAAIADEEPPLLRRAVPPGGRAHAARRAAPAQLHPPHRRLRRRLDHGRLPRRGDRADPRHRSARAR